MSGYPNYSAPPNWQPPAYAPPPQGPYQPQKKSSGGNGCVLAAVIVFMVVGIPTILACGGIGYFIYFVKTEIDKDQAKMAENRARIQEQAARGGIPSRGGPSFPFAEEPAAIASAKDAIDALSTNDWQRQKKGAEWLATHPVDETQKSNAAQALEKGIESYHRDVAESSLKALDAYGSKENAPAVGKAMKDHRVDRKLAIEQLGKWKDAASAEVLVELLDDGGAEGEAAESALANIGVAASSAVGKRLDPSRPLANARAEKLLAGYGVDVQDTLITARLSVIKSNDVFRKRDAIKALAAMPVKAERQAEVARALDRLVLDNDRGSRDEVLAALLVWGDKESVPNLVELVRREPFVNKTMISLLGKFKDPRAVDGLVALLDNGFVDDGELNRALVNYGAEAEKAVLKSLHDSRRKSRDRARAILTALDTKPDVLLTQTLADLATRDDQRARSAMEYISTITVAEERRKEVAEALLAAARSPSPFVSGPAVEALVKFNDPSTFEAVSELARNPIARGGLSHALHKAGPAGEDLLIHLLDHSDVSVTFLVCSMLQQHGTEKCIKPLQAIGVKATAAMNVAVQANVKNTLDAVQRRVKK